MKQLLVGGGALDFATLHPLGVLLAALAAAAAALQAARAFGRGRRARLRPPAAAPDRTSGPGRDAGPIRPDLPPG